MTDAPQQAAPDPVEQATTPQVFEHPVNVRVGGAVLRIPAGATPDTIKKAIENFRKTPQFDGLIDKKSGASPAVRAIVGKAPTEDRLANLKKWHPDAIKWGDDNFLFTSPVTGKPTLYNEEQDSVLPTKGDLASIAGEGALAVGAGLGAAAGTMFGGPGVGTAVGAGLGAAVTDAMLDYSLSNIGGMVDTRTGLERSIDSTLEFGGSAAGQRLGELAPFAFKRAIGAGRSAIDGLVEAYKRLGVPETAGAVTGSKAVGMAEQMLAVTPASSTLMQKNAEKIYSALTKAARGIESKIGKVQTRPGAGETIRRAAIDAAERFDVKQNTVYEKAFDMVGRDTLVPLNNVSSLRQELLEKIAKAPESLKPSLQNAVAKLTALMDDAGESGGVQFDALREIRTNLGRDLKHPNLVTSSGASNAALERVYAAITQDLSDAGKAAGSDAKKILDVADRYTRQFMRTSGQTLDKIGKFDADEKAFEYVNRLTVDGSQQLARLRRAFTDDEWGTVAASVLRQMGERTPGAQGAADDVFSASRFLTNWNKIHQKSPKSLEILFGGTKYEKVRQPLSDLVKVSQSLKEVEKLTNTSNTSNNMMMYMSMSALAGSLYFGGPQGAVGTAFTTLVVPNTVARLMTWEPFVKWLIKPVTNPNGIGAHIGRLAGLAQDYPEYREDIQRYVATLNANLDAENKPQPEKTPDTSMPVPGKPFLKVGQDEPGQPTSGIPRGQIP